MDEMETGKGLMSPAEAAKTLGISQVKLRRMGDVPGVNRTARGHRRYSEEAIRQLRLLLATERDSIGSASKLGRLSLYARSMRELINSALTCALVSDDMEVLDVTTRLAEELNRDPADLVGRQLSDLATIDGSWAEMSRLRDTDPDFRLTCRSTGKSYKARLKPNAPTAEGFKTHVLILGEPAVRVEQVKPVEDEMPATLTQKSGRQGLAWRMGELAGADEEGAFAFLQARIPVEMMADCSLSWIGRAEERLEGMIATWLPADAEIFRTGELSFAVLMRGHSKQRAVLCCDKVIRSWSRSVIGRAGLSLGAGVAEFNAGRSAERSLGAARQRCVMGLDLSNGMTVFEDDDRHAMTKSILDRLQFPTARRSAVRTDTASQVQEIMWSQAEPTPTDLWDPSGLQKTLQSALQELRERAEAGRARLRVSVKIDARQLMSEQSLRLALKVADENAEDAKYIILAIDQKELYRLRVTVGSVLQPLRRLGVRVALTGFGSMGSTTSMLQDLKPDYVVISMESCGSIAEEAITLAKVAAVASRFARQVLVDGVRNDEDLKRLAEVGVQYAVKLWEQPSGGV